MASSERLAALIAKGIVGPAVLSSTRVATVYASPLMPSSAVHVLSPTRRARRGKGAGGGRGAASSQSLPAAPAPNFLRRSSGSAHRPPAREVHSSREVGAALNSNRSTHGDRLEDGTGGTLEGGGSGVTDPRAGPREGGTRQAARHSAGRSLGPCGRSPTGHGGHQG
eukprot:6227864-Pyramimonas_sp.AAC.1